MLRAAAVLFSWLILFAAAAQGEEIPTPTAMPLEVRPGERLLVVAPHPDDETLGAGGLIERVFEKGGSAQVVLLTAGDGYVEAVKHETHDLHPRPRDFVAYGERRLAEARAAVRLLSGGKARLRFLGFPDGGLDGLLRAHWWRTSPERSRTTGASDPPYVEAMEPDLPYDGDDLRRELGEIVREVNPTLVALPDPLDRHPDHRATGLFTLLALGDWVAGLPAKTPRPRLLGYLVHWPAWPPGWDAPAPPGPDTMLDLPSGFRGDSVRRTSLRLDDAEIEKKHQALARYATQQRVMPGLLGAFLRRCEPFVELPISELHQVEMMVEEGLAAPSRSGR